jgi:hypothetical protein
VLQVALSPASPFLQLGIPLDGYERFLDTREGAKFWHRHCCLVTIKKGEYLYVPCGFVVHPLVHEPRTPRNFNPRCSVYLHIPLCGILNAAMSQETRNAFNRWNGDMLATKSATKMWQDRKEFFVKAMVE